LNLFDSGLDRIEPITALCKPVDHASFIELHGVDHPKSAQPWAIYKRIAGEIALRFEERSEPKGVAKASGALGSSSGWIHVVNEIFDGLNGFHT
jgi:hypothetical protein